ncbi:MAG: hypothetical protein Q8O00_03875, partial [Holophaga sp.]|nr:hypothetical protein [Holophaga sp.]
MAILPRVVSLTPLDALRALLAEYADGNTSFSAQLGSALQGLRRQALPVLGPLLAKSEKPKGLRRVILSQVGKYDWPEWTPFILNGLLVEPDLGTFDEGCAVLGALGVREAAEALKNLQTARPSPDHQAILAREAALYQSQQPFSHYLTRLMEGSGNPRLAMQGAKVLSGISTSEDLPQLMEAIGSGDEVVFHLLLRIIAGIPGEESTQFLSTLVEHSTKEILDNQTLLELLHKTQGLARASAKVELRKLVCERFADRASSATDALSNALSSSAEIDGHALLEPIRAISEGHSETFLLEALGLLIDNKVARFSAYHSESADLAESRHERLNSTL